jgi:hypothetical protein
MSRKLTQSAPERSAVLTKAVIRAAEFLGLKRNQLAATLGLSAATLSRMYAGDYLLDPKSKTWELAALLVRLYRGLDAIMASDERSLQAWMRNPNADLNETPIDLVSQVAGLASVVAYVDAHRARV